MASTRSAADHIAALRNLGGMLDRVCEVLEFYDRGLVVEPYGRDVLLQNCERIGISVGRLLASSMLAGGLTIAEMTGLPPIPVTPPPGDVPR
jgi:hypothetical protein